MNETLTVTLACEADLPAWMALARLTRANFPGMETQEGLAQHEEAAHKNIARLSAVCAKAGCKLVGALLFSRNHNELSYLVVHPDFRRRAIAAELVRLMLPLLDPARDVTVTTFRAGDPLGDAARAFYERLGFEKGGFLEAFGHPCQELLLPVGKAAALPAPAAAYIRPACVVSACLCGFPCRYDGKAQPHPQALALFKSGQALPVCPEIFGGLSTPRVPCERCDGVVRAQNGADCTSAYTVGAMRTLSLCKAYQLHTAVLKQRSPSCGSREIYDGSFSGTRIPGEGVSAALLRENGIAVRGEEALV